MISLAGRSKAARIAALFNNARTHGLGFFQYTSEEMSETQAAFLLERETYFDYIQGRVLKVDLSGDELDPRLYDRDNGDGAAQRAIESVPIETKGEAR